MTEKLPKWLKVSAAAAHFGVSRTTVHEWVTRGRVPSRKDGRGHVEIDVRAATSWRETLAAEGQQRGRKGSPGAGLIVVPVDVANAAPPVPGSDAAGMSELEFWRARVNALHARAAVWETWDAPPPAYVATLVELRHSRDALSAEQARIAAENAARGGGVDQRPISEKLALLADRMRNWPEQMLVLALREYARRWGATLSLSRPDGTVWLDVPTGRWIVLRDGRRVLLGGVEDGKLTPDEVLQP